jgi:hypothetical protein
MSPGSNPNDGEVGPDQALLKVSCPASLNIVKRHRGGHLEDGPGTNRLSTAKTGNSEIIIWHRNAMLSCFHAFPLIAKQLIDEAPLPHVSHA